MTSLFLHAKRANKNEYTTFFLDVRDLQEVEGEPKVTERMQPYAAHSYFELRPKKAKTNIIVRISTFSTKYFAYIIHCYYNEILV